MSLLLPYFIPQTTKRAEGENDSQPTFRLKWREKGVNEYYKSFPSIHFHPRSLSSDLLREVEESWIWSEDFLISLFLGGMVMT
jgi:hypothetical protein